MIPTINHNESILEPLKEHEEKNEINPAISIVASINNSIQQLAIIRDKIESLALIKDDIVKASKINPAEVLTLIVLIEKFNESKEKIEAVYNKLDNISKVAENIDKIITN